MAEQIEPTPTLKGKQACEFIKKINTPPSKEKIAYMKETRKRFEVDYN
ncbi:MAG: hypothetical protein FWH54_00060 [Methanobrevibacter sp.]|nr:hypothetical protein [Methanobrevibacter sp.]